VGARLLKLMGWRQGKGIGSKAARGARDVGDDIGDDVGDEAHASAVAFTGVSRGGREGGGGARERGGGGEGGGGGGGEGGDSSVRVGWARRPRRWGSVATALIEDTPAYILHPKVNNHGVGYDPFEGAEEFRRVAEARRKHANADPRGMGAARPKRGEAFGVGVFEGEDPDEDVYRVKTSGGDEVGHTYEIMSEEDEEGDEGHGAAMHGASASVAAVLGLGGGGSGKSMKRLGGASKSFTPKP